MNYNNNFVHEMDFVNITNKLNIYETFIVIISITPNNYKTNKI